MEACLLGIALGDSLGLPMEGMKAARAAKLYGGPLRQRMFAGRGVLSDDTVMAVATLQALYRAPDDPDQFAAELAKRLRLWFWAIPPGIGLATIKSCLRLSAGFGPKKSGVNSAGNGPAVRAVVLGCALAAEPAQRIKFIKASTRVTHIHPLAEDGSQLAGLAASLATLGQGANFPTISAELCPAWPWSDSYPATGPTGYIVHTINAAFDCLANHPDDLPAVIREAVAMGGDTDSVAAIVGGIAGAGNPNSKVPAGWTSWLGWPQPRDLKLLAEGKSTRLPYERLVAQHAVSLALILPHGFRRLAPPY